MLTGKVAIVTGGGSGIGRALCHRLAKSGASVISADINLRNAQETVDLMVMGSPSSSSRAILMDCGSSDSVSSAIESALKHYGKVDIFMSNAGIAPEGSLEFPDDKWENVWKINTLSHVYAARKLMKSREEGGAGWKEESCDESKYFNVTASAAGLMGQIGSLPYSITKHAAVSCAEYLAFTYGSDALHFSCSCPQGVETALIKNASKIVRGVVGMDGMLTADACADFIVNEMLDNKFLILPHKTVRNYMVGKATATDDWIKQMRKLNKKIAGGRSKL